MHIYEVPPFSEYLPGISQILRREPGTSLIPALLTGKSEAQKGIKASLGWSAFMWESWALNLGNPTG
jgi:hypothetical protein